MKQVWKRMCRRFPRYRGIIPRGIWLLSKKFTKPCGSPLPSLNFILFIANTILTAIQSFPNNLQGSSSTDFKPSRHEMVIVSRGVQITI